MIGTIYINGVIGEDTTLLDVIKQVKAQSTSESFLVKIDSVGGYVDAGNDIYNYLKNLPQSITTYTTKAYSIASVIYMAGDERIIPEAAIDALMIHLPWLEAAGDYSTLNEYLSELKAVEDELVEFYSQAIDLDKDTVHSLLKSETYLDDSQAFDLGFATQIQPKLQAVARLHNNKKEIEQDSLMNKLTKKIDALMRMVSGVKAELILQDATGVEIVFPDLESTEVPTVDANIKVDNKPAEGEFIMPDGSTIVAANGIVTEIKTVEADEPVEETETEESLAKAEVIKQIGKWEMDVTNTSFEIGETLKYTYEDVEYSVGAGEYELQDGSRVITDADGKIVEVKPAVAEPVVEEIQEPEASNNEDVEKLLQVIETMAEKQAEIENKYVALAKSIGSDFNTKNTKENKTNVKASADNTSRAFQILTSKTK
jgi:ATP-dependent protease ClpP protease subunit